MVQWEMCSWEHIVDHNFLMNWLPQSVTRVTGTPCLETQVLTNAARTVVWLTSLSSATSSHLVFRSIINKHYINITREIEPFEFQKVSCFHVGHLGGLEGRKVNPCLVGG